MRTTTILPSAVALGAIAGASFAGGAGGAGGGQVYSNFARFGNGDISIGQASAVTGANAPIVTPFESNTASMRVSLDRAAAITTVSVLSDIQYLPDQASARPGSGLHAEGGADLGGGRGPAGVSGPVDLGAMRVSFYASAADAAARLTYASVDFDASSVLMGAWDANSAFMQITFNLGPAIDLGAGEWFVEVAQVDPLASAYFLAAREGSGMHVFQPGTLQYVSMDREFALQLGTGVAIPLPTAGSLAVMGLVALGARRRRMRVVLA